jgi:hypothetical protein
VSYKELQLIIGLGWCTSHLFCLLTASVVFLELIGHFLFILDTSWKTFGLGALLLLYLSVSHKIAAPHGIICYSFLGAITIYVLFFGNLDWILSHHWRRWNNIGTLPAVLFGNFCFILKRKWGVGLWVLLGARNFSSPRCPDRLWVPPNLLSSGYQGRKVVGTWSWPLTSN